MRSREFIADVSPRSISLWPSLSNSHFSLSGDRRHHASLSKLMSVSPACSVKQLVSIQFHPKLFFSFSFSAGANGRVLGLIM